MLLYLVLSHLPIFFSDVWGHVAYGSWILDHRTLPVYDPIVPLAEGVRLIHSAWLSQVILAFVERSGGYEGLCSLYALTILATSLIYFRTFTVLTGRTGLGFLGAAAALLFWLSRILVIRPEIFSTFCFAAMMLLVVESDRRQDEAGRSRSRVFGLLGEALLVVLFAAWANLHGAFVVGLAFLGCLCAGRAWDVAWKTRSLFAVLADRKFRRALWRTELATAATLLNPHGLDLLISTFRFGSHPNLADIAEWQKLSAASLEAPYAAVAFVLLLFVWRHSRRPIAASDVLLLGLFSTAVIFSVRMIGWFGLVYLYVVMPHIAELVNRYWPVRAVSPALPQSDEVPREGVNLAGPSFLHSLICLLLVWCGFALSPLSNPVLGETARPTASLLNRETPLGVSKFLRENPPDGQIWNPQWWGDWLAWDGPKGLQVFVTTNTVHVLPPQVWRDNLNISDAAPGWQTNLQKYRINTLVIHKERQPRLNEAARQLNGWRIVYEDSLGVVLSRNPAAANNEEVLTSATRDVR